MDKFLEFVRAIDSKFEHYDEYGVSSSPSFLLHKELIPLIDSSCLASNNR